MPARNQPASSAMSCKKTGEHEYRAHRNTQVISGPAMTDDSA
jgi:hypothetical protein